MESEEPTSDVSPSFRVSAKSEPRYRTWGSHGAAETSRLPEFQDGKKVAGDMGQKRGRLTGEEGEGLISTGSSNLKNGLRRAP